MQPSRCNQCGGILGSQTRFCVNCGAPVTAAVGPGPAAPAVPPPPTATLVAPRPIAAPSLNATTVKGISPGEMLKFGWNTVKRRFWPAIGLFLLGIAIVIVAELAPALLPLALGDALGATLGVLVFAFVG